MNREVKSQPIRVFDVVAFSPFLVWLGLRRDRRLSDTERFLLVAMGIGTAVYNARNYLRIEARETSSLQGRSCCSREGEADVIPCKRPPTYLGH